MNYFTKEKYLKLTILILVLLNLATVGGVWLTRKDDHRGPGKHMGAKRGGEKGKLGRELGFSDTQNAQFERLRDGHKAQAMAIRDLMKKEKDTMFAMVSTASTDDSLWVFHAERIGALHIELETITFGHFRDIRQLCDDEQKPKFDAIIQEVSRHLERKGHPGPPRRH